MEAIKLSISARYNDFKNSLNGFLFDYYRNPSKKVQEYFEGQGSFKLQYTFDGALILYIVRIINEKVLDVEISIPMNSNKGSERHVCEIRDALLKKFRSGDFPFGFKNFISDIKQTEIMERLWIESYKTQKAEAYLSTIVLIGSILEGILYYQITKSTENKTLAGKARYPSDKDKNGKLIKKLGFHEWTLSDMIGISYKCKWINKQYYDYSEVLRDHRNFVHPFLQLEENFAMPDDTACEMSRIALKGIFDNLLENDRA